jgi:N-acetylmuramoyl-L-alanine amidase
MSTLENMHYIYNSMSHGSKDREVKNCIIHCSAEPPNRDTDAATIHRWHVEGRGWKAIAYHWVIKEDGGLEGGRHFNHQGAHTSGHNEDSVGICMIGGLDYDMKPTAEMYTEPQWATLTKLLRMVYTKWPGIETHGHNEYANKACPCFNVQDNMHINYRDIKRQVENSTATPPPAVKPKFDWPKAQAPLDGPRPATILVDDLVYTYDKVRTDARKKLQQAQNVPIRGEHGAVS